MHRSLAMPQLFLMLSSAIDVARSTGKEPLNSTQARRPGEFERNATHLGVGRLECDDVEESYKCISKKNVDGNDCQMDAYSGGSRWPSRSQYRYEDTCGDPCYPDDCKRFCDAQPDCAGFVDNWFNKDEKYATCTFKTSTVTRKQKAMVFYMKIISPAPAPVPIPPTSTCLGGWPQFASVAELNANPWSQYFVRVYGIVPQFSYPLCIGDFWHFYDDLVSATGASAPAIAGNCPSSHAPEGQRYVQNNMYQPAGVSFSWHAPPYAAFAPGAWAEVSHMADPFGDEHFGMWLLWAKGNGVWFNVGNTRSFGEHAEAYTYFSASGNEDLSQKAAAQGYDSIQFVSHHDHVNYPCDTTAGSDYMGLEIVAVKLTGTYACGAQGGAPSTILSGWQGSAPCQCDSSRTTLNCGVSASEAGAAIV